MDFLILAHALRQAFNYAKDYGEPSAYLVIFNISLRDLIFEQSSSDAPPRLVIGDKTVFLVTIVRA